MSFTNQDIEAIYGEKIAGAPRVYCNPHQCYNFFSDIWHGATSTVIPAALDIAGATVGIPPEVTNSVYGAVKGGISHGLPGAEQGAVTGAEQGVLADAGNAVAGAFSDTGISTPLSSLSNTLGITDPSTSAGFFGSSGTAANDLSSLSSSISSGVNGLADVFSGGGGTSTATASTLQPLSDISTQNVAVPAIGTDTAGQDIQNLLNDTNYGSSTDIPANLQPQNINDVFGNVGGTASGIGTQTANGVGASVLSPGATDAMGNPIASGPSTTGNNGSWLSNLFSGNGTGTGKGGFGLGSAVNLAGLAGSALVANQNAKGYNQEKTSAGTLASNSATLENYLNTGTLPPGVQASINQGLASAQAAIKSKYASMGMSGSSSEAQELAGAEQQASTASANVAMQLLNTGIEEAGMSDQIYQFLMNNALKNDSQLISNFTKFASGLVGGTTPGQGTTINIGTGANTTTS